MMSDTRVGECLSIRLFFCFFFVFFVAKIFCFLCFFSCVALFFSFVKKRLRPKFKSKSVSKKKNVF